MRLNLGLENVMLYAGCVIVDGNITTPKHEAAQIVQNNIQKLIVSETDREEITLFGAGPTWAYLIAAFEAFKGFHTLYYMPGKGERMCIYQYPQ